MPSDGRISWLSLPFRWAVKAYQYGISPYIGGRCRYVPTCSEYADEALRLHGPIKGLYLTARRFLSCHPWGGSGYDPVPSHDQNCREGTCHGHD